MKTLKAQKGKMLWMAVILGAVFLLWNQASMKAEAYIQTQGTVTAESANIRQNADTSSTAIASVKKGDTLTINNEVTGTDGKVWYYVYVDNSTMGYILAELVEKKGGATANNTTANTDNTVLAPDNNTDTNNNNGNNNAGSITSVDGVTAVQNVSATVTGSTVNVRKDANGIASIVSKVQKGMVVTITGQKQDAEGKTWYQVFFTANGTEVTGFIRSDYLQPDGEVLPVQEQPADTQTPEEEGSNEPVEQTKDYDTVYKENAEGTSGWYLVNQLTGQEYTVDELMKAKQENEPLLAQAQKNVKSQKITIIILVLILILFAIAIVLLVLKFKDQLLDEFSGNGRQEPVRTRRPVSGRNGQKRPVSRQQSGSTRPQGTSNRPQGSVRPQGSGTRPQGNSARPQGSSAKPQGSSIRPQGSSVRPQGNSTRPQSSVRPQEERRRDLGTGSVQMPQADGIQQRTRQSVEEQKMQNVTRDTEQKWKSKNFMSDDDEFEFEFLNWDGQEEKQ